MTPFLLQLTSTREYRELPPTLAIDEILPASAEQDHVSEIISATNHGAVASPTYLVRVEQDDRCMAWCGRKKYSICKVT